jgi:hypothetical protein
VPAPRMNSVWAVVNHLALWHEEMLGPLRGQPVDRGSLGAEDGWPPVGDATDEAAWTAARERLAALNAELGALVGGLSDAELEESPEPGAKRWQLLHGLVNHTSYHTCEVICARQLLDLRSPVPPRRERTAT